MSSPQEPEQVKSPTAIISPHRGPEPTRHGARRAGAPERIALVDLLDRVLAGGVVVTGEVTLTIADVDMVTISLRALVTSVSALARSGTDADGPGR